MDFISLYKFDFTFDVDKTSTQITSRHDEVIYYTSLSPVQAVRDSVIYARNRELETPGSMLLYGIVYRVAVGPLSTVSQAVRIFGDKNGGSYVEKAEAWLNIMEQEAAFLKEMLK